MFLEWLWPALTAVGFALIGLFGHALFVRLRDTAANRSAGDVLRQAQREAEVLLKEAQLAARDERMRTREKAEQELQARQQVLSTAADRLSKRDERMEREEQRLEERAQALDLRAGTLQQAQQAAETDRDARDTMIAEERERLEALASLTAEEARAKLLTQLENELSDEAAQIIRKSKEDALATAEAQARDIVTHAIQRVAADQVSDVTTTALQLPNEAMKGRIIGREGRNIRALEMATGVTIIIDDSPEVVVLSSFDPIRREIAKVVLERLILDGRINPVRIEEMADKVTAELDDLILKAGEEAVEALRLHRIPLDLLRLLGRLKFRTSYSQNVLKHSVEAAWLAAMMASEVGLDPELAKRAALFHDIGKAVDHEVQGRHAEIGADLLQKAGESELVINAVRAHHGEAEAGSAYASLVAAADAITASRPGARTDTTAHFLDRMDALEDLARGEPGVIRSLAMQAGRELRIFVEPTAMDDRAAIQLARTLSRRIEEKMDYPGQIKVTVIRETRCVEYAR
jgi:ribonucrease Y